MKRKPSIAAVHEAGHAVASIICEIPFRGVRVHRRRPGSGTNYGTMREIRLFNESSERLYARAVVSLAGPHSEALYTRRKLILILLAGGKEDYARCKPFVYNLALRLLIETMHASRRRRAGQDELENFKSFMWEELFALTKELVQQHWEAILAVAHQLDARGFLNVGEVRKIVRKHHRHVPARAVRRRRGPTSW